MVGIPKLRIKFGPEGYVRTFQTFPGSAKKIEHSVDDDLSHSAERSKKRGANELEDVQAKKKQKLDSDVSSQCLALLRLLMEHRVGWIFNTPVDPVELKIPDYFSVILKPMDLGTVKSKLLKNEYGNTDEFAADVLLTFTNAMLYNPPDNWVHKIGKEMKEIFEVRWELLKKKKVSELSGIEGSKRQPVEVDCSRQRSPRTSASSRIFSVGLTKPAKENLEKVSLSSQQVKMQIKKDTRAMTPKALPTKLRIEKLDQGLGVSSAVKIPVKGSARTAGCKCDRIICICLKFCSSSGNGVSLLTDCQVKNTSGAQASESEPQPNGPVTSRIERTGSVNSQLDKASNSALLDNELKTASAALPPVPPEKALRAAMLKTQYADTILKAKQRKVFDQNNKADLIGRQIEKEEMKRTQREEKARIEAGLRAVKIAAQMRTQAELKKKRERQQLELAKVGKSFDFERHSHLKVEKDFVSVCGCSNLEMARLTHEELGLFLENEYWPELEEIGWSEICYAMRLDDLEEGEIL